MPTVYACPLNDSGELAIYLPLLLDQCTTNANTLLLGRINVKTAPVQVLTALLGVSTVLQATDVTNIQNAQPMYTYAETPDPIYLTPAWLMINAQVAATTMQSIEPYITTYTQVYSFQSIGYFDGGGPVARMEAVIDLNPTQVPMGIMTYMPRILDRRDISSLLGTQAYLQNVQQ
jgi:hypothetical protein